MITSRLALLRHIWAMMQTRGEAASLVLRLQLDALLRGIAWFAAAAVTAMALMMALVLLVAFGAPAEYRVAALAGLALALLVAAIACVISARRQLARDAGLIAEFTAGLRLDLAMVNLALKDPAADDEGAVVEREQARAEVREAAAASEQAKAEVHEAAAARPAEPEPSELDLPTPGVTAPEAMTQPGTEERAPHGTP